VNLKKGEASLGAYAYDAILPKLREELDRIIAAKQ
jgi:(E)-4-hydroxy-3-methylbut-2-enyl-diphosphate synthase